MDEWAISVMGLYEQAATSIVASRECLAALRKDGVIR